MNSYEPTFKYLTITKTNDKYDVNLTNYAQNDEKDTHKIVLNCNKMRRNNRIVEQIESLDAKSVFKGIDEYNKTIAESDFHIEENDQIKKDFQKITIELKKLKPLHGAFREHTGGKKRRTCQFMMKT